MVNLLPWRDALRKKHRLQFIMVLAGCSLLNIILIISWCLYLHYKIRAQELHKSQLQKQLKIIKQQDRSVTQDHRYKKELVARINSLRSLQHHNQQVIDLFRALTVIVPDEIHIVELNKQHKELMLIGISRSNHEVTKLVNRVNKSSLISKVILQEVISRHQRHPRFVLKCFFT